MNSLLPSIPLPENVAEVAIEPVVEAVEQAVKQSIRLTALPTHEDDFAKSWFYGLQKELVADEIILEYNMYLQVLEELKEDTIKLPENFVGKDIAADLITFVLKDFRKRDITPDLKNNLYHRAFYSHCVKRAIDNLRQGEFTDSAGYRKKHPEIADIIERRIDEIYFENIVK